jgi:hypothetical protein
MNVREAMTAKNTIYRISTTAGDGLTMVLSSEFRLNNNFLEVSPEDFMYSFSRAINGKKVQTTINGDNPKYSKHLNVSMVMAYEEIHGNDPRYDVLVEMIDQCASAKCDIALPPEKKIILAN